jgi:hypothetical protein
VNGGFGTGIAGLVLDWVPDNYVVERLTSSVVVPGDIVVYGFMIYSTNASTQYVNVFDADVLPADNAVPLFSLVMAAHSEKGVAYPGNGRRFHRGIVLCNSSTDTKKTIGSADCFFDVQYQPLYVYQETLMETEALRLEELRAEEMGGLR